MSAGIQSQISIAKESTWGTPVTPSKSIPVRPSGGIEIKTNLQKIPAIKGQLQKNYNVIKGKVAYEGDYTMDMFGDYPGFFLLSALGTDTPALHSGETIVYDHVFTETLPKPSLTIEEAIGENVRRYAGAICSGFKIEGKTGEMLSFTPSIMAKTQATATEIAAAFSTVPAFDFAQLVVKIGGTTIGEVENFSLEYKNGLEMIYALGANEPAYNGVKGGSELTGKMDLYLDSTTLTELTDYISKTSRSIELIATGKTIGSAANYVLDITIPNAFYDTATTKISDSTNVLSLSFEGIYDTATSKMLGVTLTNLLTSY